MKSQPVVRRGSSAFRRGTPACAGKRWLKSLMREPLSNHRLSGVRVRSSAHRPISLLRPALARVLIAGDARRADFGNRRTIAKRYAFGRILCPVRTHCPMPRAV